MTVNEDVRYYQSTEQALHPRPFVTRVYGGGLTVGVRYKVSEISNSREGVQVLIHDTDYCWKTVKTFSPSRGFNTAAARRMGREYCAHLNEVEETLDRGLS